MLGIVSYAFTVFSKLRSDSVVLSTKNQLKKTIFQTFCNFSRTMNRLNPKLFFFNKVTKRDVFAKGKKIRLFHECLAISIFSENGS